MRLEVFAEISVQLAPVVRQATGAIRREVEGRLFAARADADNAVNAARAEVAVAHALDATALSLSHAEAACGSYSATGRRRSRLQPQRGSRDATVIRKFGDMPGDLNAL
jgi:hypothetical protein